MRSVEIWPYRCIFLLVYACSLFIYKPVPQPSSTRFPHSGYTSRCYLVERPPYPVGRAPSVRHSTPNRQYEVSNNHPMGPFRPQYGRPENRNKGPQDLQREQSPMSGRQPGLRISSSFIQSYSASIEILIRLY